MYNPPAVTQHAKGVGLNVIDTRLVGEELGRMEDALPERLGRTQAPPAQLPAPSIVFDFASTTAAVVLLWPREGAAAAFY